MDELKDGLKSFADPVIERKKRVSGLLSC